MAISRLIWPIHAGNLFIPDAGNNRIRMVDSAGTITTVAGGGSDGLGDGGPATNAQLNLARLIWPIHPNHFHLLVRSGAAPLSTLMRRLLTAYAVRFNHRHRRSGHLFQNRFKSIVVEDEPYFLELVRYLHLNPVRARLVPDVDALETYPWTGHATLLGRTHQLGQNIDFVLVQFGRTRAIARQAYVRFVTDGVAQGRRPDLLGGGLRRSLRGCQRLLEVKRGRERWAFDERILGSSDFVLRTIEELPARPAAGSSQAMDALLFSISQKYMISIEEIRSNSHRAPAVVARAAVSYVAIRDLGFTPTAVAAQLGISRRSVARAFERAQQIGLASDAALTTFAS
jgi:hypothetical protein